MIRSLTRSVATTAMTAALALSLSACSKGPQSRLGPAAHRYTVRGEVVRVADEPDGRNVYIRHEAIPEFTDRTGARVGMEPMVMPFQPGPGVQVRVRPGDKVRFRFGVDWERNATELELIEALPPDTALSLGP